MTTTQDVAAGQPTTNYEVLWGIEENQRQMWTDYGDGSAVSENAQDLAYRLLIDHGKAGTKAGLFVNGAHEAGHDFTEEFDTAEAEEAQADELAY
jgi:hypothetical protein